MSRVQLSRERAAQLGAETRQILDARRYSSPAGADVDLGPLLEAARAGARTYLAEEPLPAERPGAHQTVITVRNEDTLAAAQRLAAAGQRAAALVFASAKHPGGGWLSGARAQEETVARASGLVAAIAESPMYGRNAALGDALYTDDLIYAPDVPVFRDAEGRLLEAPYPCAMIVAPAVNAGVVLERDRARGGEVRATMARRIGRVLAVAAAHGHPALVLGAWGCGVFGNDPAAIAALFAAALGGPFRGAFAEVVFAVLDHTPERRFIGPFAAAFGDVAGTLI